MNNAITLASVEAILRNTITNSGTILVRLSDEVLKQMNDIVAKVKEVTGYDESKLDQEQMEIALERAKMFYNRLIGTEYVDGYLALEDQARVDAIMVDLADDLKEAPAGLIVPVVLVNKILNEVKYFAV
jgi:hypothetical protein